MPTPFVTYLVAAMSVWLPPRESDVERYQAIAADVADVAFDPEEEPAFSGERSRERTALLMLSIASFESQFRADVDRGDVRGDHGTSWGLFQIHIGQGRSKEGWTGRELVADRKKGVRAGLRIVRDSFKWCARLPAEDRLSGYTKGRCEKDSYSRARLGRAKSYWKAHPFADESPDPTPKPQPEEPAKDASEAAVTAKRETVAKVAKSE